MSDIHIVGYDLEDRAVEVPVPVDKLGEAKAAAGVPETDPNVHGTYPLTEAAARKIANAPPGLSYFLEAIAE